MPSTPPHFSRRSFLKTAAALAAPVVIPATALGLDDRRVPSDRINLGFIGCGGKGMAHIRDFVMMPDVQIIAVCDVDRLHQRDLPADARQSFGLEAAQQVVAQYYASQSRGSGASCEGHSDYRELCGRDDIDAVVVSTPDHWHALCDLEAIRNGKDVYGEKPIAHLFREGQQLVREVAERGAVFQTGSQQRSDARFRRAAEIVRNGLLGTITRVEVGLPIGYLESQGDATVAVPPEHLDYELWTGPAEMLPYMRARHHRWWRGHRAYGGGTLMDWIGHHNDIAHWGLGMDRSGPLEVEAVGWTWPDTEVYDTPVEYEVRSTYTGGTVISIASRHPMGVKFIGEDGWVYADRGKLECSREDWAADEFVPGPVELERSDNHLQNFIDCVKSRQQCIAPAETGHRSITPGHLAYVSQELGRPVRWNPVNEQFVDDADADALLEFNYRPPWTL